MPRGKDSALRCSPCLAFNSSSRSVLSVPPLLSACQAGTHTTFSFLRKNMHVLKSVSQPAEQQASPKITFAFTKLTLCLVLTAMGGFAAMLTQLLSQLGGGAAGLQVVDMTGLKGNYDGSLEISLADTPAEVDPGGGGSSLMDAVQS